MNITSLEKPFRLSIYALLIVLSSLFAIFLDSNIAMPLHEAGHLIACHQLRVNVTRVSADSVDFSFQGSGLNVNLAGFMGGFFAGSILLLIFIIFYFSSKKFIVTELKKIKRRSTKSLAILVIILVVQMIIITDFGMQYVAAIIEGVSLFSYHSIFNSIPLLFIALLGVSILALLMQHSKVDSILNKELSKEKSPLPPEAVTM